MGLFSSNLTKRHDIDHLKAIYSFVQEIIANKSKADLSTEERSEILSIYNTYYPTTHIIPGQRQTAHSTFITIYTFILSVFGYFISSKYQALLQLSMFEKAGVIIIGDIFLICIAYIWSRTLRAYANFNYMLIMVTKSLEEYLPIRPINTIFKASEFSGIPTNLAEEMSFMPKLMTAFSISVSMFIFFMLL